MSAINFIQSRKKTASNSEALKKVALTLGPHGLKVL